MKVSDHFHPLATLPLGQELMIPMHRLWQVPDLVFVKGEAENPSTSWESKPAFSGPTGYPTYPYQIC